MWNGLTNIVRLSSLDEKLTMLTELAVTKTTESRQVYENVGFSRESQETNVKVPEFVSYVKEKKGSAESFSEYYVRK